MKRVWDQYFKYNIPFHVFGLTALLLIVISFVIPPQGEIHPSVLKGVGELMGFAALWSVHVAIVRGGTGKLKHGKTELEIIPKTEEEEDN